MNRTFLLSALASTIALGSALAACGSRVICDGMCGGGAGGSNVVPGTSVHAGQVTSAGSSMGTGPGGVDSVILYGTDPVTLRFTNFPVSCSDPEKNPPFDQCGWYVLEVTFPASLLQPGVLDASNPSVTVFEQSASLPNSSTPGDCSGTGAVTGGPGGYPDGTLMFVSIDANAVVVQLDGVSTFSLDGFELNGLHTATRCK